MQGTCNCNITATGRLLPTYQPARTYAVNACSIRKKWTGCDHEMTSSRGFERPTHPPPPACRRNATSPSCRARRHLSAAACIKSYTWTPFHSTFLLFPYCEILRKQKYQLAAFPQVSYFARESRSVSISSPMSFTVIGPTTVA